jgi:hypothetical protein
MQKPFSLAKQFSEHPIVTGCSGISGLLALVTPIAEKVGILKMPGWYNAVVFTCVGVLLIALFVWGLVAGTRRANQLRRVAEQLHEINHLYRDRVGSFLELVDDDELEENENEDEHAIEYDFEYAAKLAREERETLHEVCQKISEIFHILTERPCMASIRLLSSDKKKLKLYTRSHKQTKRDQQGQHYKVKSYERGKNLGFVQAAEQRDGHPSYFLSDDLEADEKRERYTDERRNYADFYKSLLIVPIRMCREPEPDLLGFLYVDTPARNCLSRSQHLHLLCALADQMYNYISLMRVEFMPLESAEQIESIIDQQNE